MFKATAIAPDGIQIIISSDMAAVDCAVAAFQRRFDRRPAEDLFNAALVLRELLTNAVAHGNCLRPDRMVSCRVEPAQENRLKIVVADEGDGFSREGMTFELPADPLTDRHRGLALVHAYSEAVVFNEAGNRVAVHLKFAAEAPSLIEQNKENRMDTRRNATRHSSVDKTGPAAGASGKRLRIVEEDASIRMTFASEMPLVERAVRSASTFAEGCALLESGAEGEDGFPELARVLRELLINAVVHGNGERADKQVFCEIEKLEGDLFRASVRDEGEGFDHRNAPALTSPTAQWEGSGGFRLVRSISEQIGFNDAGNEATVYIRRPRRTRYDVSMEGDRAVIRPNGNISAASAPDLKQRLVELIDGGAARYSFDFARVAEIDSMSLTVFVVFVKTLMKRNIQAELEIINGNDNIRKLFTLTRLDTHYMMM